MNRPSPRIYLFFGALVVLLIVFACHLDTTPESEETFTFPTLRETIGDVDSVLILLNDTTGKKLIVLFEARVTASTSFAGLKAEGYHGGKVVIYIEAWKDGQLIYKTERGFDPDKGGDQERIVHVTPPRKARDSLRLAPDTLTLALKGPASRFSPIFTPLSSVLPVTWTALQAGIVDISPDGLVTPRSQGITRVVAALRANPLVSDTAFARVLPVQAVDSIRFEKRVADLFMLGAAEILTIKIHPPLAPPEVVFSVRDSGLVRLVGSSILGLKEGETWVHAISQEDPSKRDSLAVLVLSQEPVDSVRLAEDTLRLFVNGQGLPLTPSLYPARSKARFFWHSEDEVVATVDSGGRVSPLSPGQTLVVVRARADTTKRDQALILVKRDVPRIRAGGDTVIARGVMLTHSLSVTQEYGQVTMFKWDLDGDGRFEDSSLTPPAALSHQYNDAKEYVVRFLARDSEGNDTIHIRRVRAVNGRVVQITSPKDGSSTNQGSISVIWQLDGAIRTDTTILNLGTNVLRRSAVDSAGNVYTHAVTVTLDRTPPEPPLVKGPAIPVTTLTPRWSWSSSDTSGSGEFRFRLDNPDLDPSSPSFDTAYLAAERLTEGIRTLYVQERDDAGNWSASGSFSIRIDTTPPPAPAIQVNPASPTNNPRPTWSWTGGTGDAHRFYRFKLDDDDFRTGAKDTTATSFQPTAALSEGVHTLYVQARDSAGNWSSSISGEVTLDFTPPNRPILDSTPRSPLNSLRPKFKWISGGGGAKIYRARIDGVAFGSENEQLGSEFTPLGQLSEGSHIIFVQERDAAGNWSEVASRKIVLALRGPLTPENPYLTSSLYGKLDFDVDANGRGYVAYKEGDSTSNTLRVKRFVGHAWEALGDPSPLATSKSLRSFAVSRLGQPVLLMFDESSNQASVLRYASNQWHVLGQNSFHAGGVGEVSLAINESGTPFAAFRDESDTAGRASVMRFNGNSWEYMGSRWISQHFSIYFEVAISKNGYPVVAYLENDNPDFGLCRIAVQRFDAASQTWRHIGPTGLHSESNGRFSFRISQEDSIFIGLNATESAGGGEIYKFIGAGWIAVGDVISSDGEKPILAIDSNGTKYAGYNRPYPQSAMLKVLRGNTWLTMGTDLLPSGIEKMAIGLNGVPWVSVTSLDQVPGRAAIWKVSLDP